MSERQATILSRKRAPLLGVLVTVALAVAVLMACACSPSGAGNRPTLVFFRAANCPYCKQMTPIVNEIEKEYGKQLNVIYAEVEQQKGKELARQHGIIGFPTILLLDSEDERVNLFRGVIPRTVLDQALGDLLQTE